MAATLPADGTGAWVQTDKLTSHPLPSIRIVDEMEDRPLITVGEDDWFGQSMSLDEGTLAVGAPGGAATERPGEVHVYEPDGLGWASVARLTADIPGDDFGYSVALDQSTLIVGAPALGDKAAPGLAYVYEWTAAGGWVLVDSLSEPDTRCFGISVALHGDTAAVGAPCRGEVRAFVYERTSTGWSKAADIPNAGGWKFGSPVALSEGLLVVGAGAGPARVYEPVDGAWTQSAELAIGRSTSVAISGSTIAVGDIEANRVKLFERTSDGWAPSAALVPPPDGVADESPFFGAALAFSGEGDVLAVGAVGDDRTPPGTPPVLPEVPGNPVFNPGRVARTGGAVHIYELGPDGWVHQAKLAGADTRSENSRGDLFGASVQLSFDGRTVLAGAPADACCWDPMNGRLVTGQHWLLDHPCGISNFACVIWGYEADAVYVFSDIGGRVSGGSI